MNLFCCYKKGFTNMITWMTGKYSMKHHYQRKKIFTVTLTWKILLMQITGTQKKFVKDFEIKNLGRHRDLYVQNDTLLLAHEFNNFWNVCLKINGLDLFIFFLHQN